MDIHIFSIIILLLVFIIGAVFSLNVGILGFVAAYGYFIFSDQVALADIFGKFPADLFILLVGITYLFAIVQANGTIDVITNTGLNLVRGNVGMVPWLILILCATLTSIGVASLAVCSIVAPIGLKMAYDAKISPLLMAMMIHLGIVIGGFSPLSLFGIIVNGVLVGEGIEFSPIKMYLNIAFFIAISSIFVFIALGGLKLFRQKSKLEDPVANVNYIVAQPPKVTLNRYQFITLVGIIALIVLVAFFELNMGFTALTIALILGCADIRNQNAILNRVPWTIILLVAGIVSFVGVLDSIGTIAYVSGLISDLGNPVMATLGASYLGGFVSVFASTTGFLAAIMKFVAPILSDPTISTTAIVSSIAVSANIVDLSPLSSGGALMLANARGIAEQKFFRQLLLATVGLTLIGPGLAWFIFVFLGFSF